MGINSIKKSVIGVDISYYCTRYAIVDVRGNIIASDKFPTADYPEFSQYIDKLATSIMELAEAHGGYETIRSVGISCPSANFVSGCIENAANLPWKGVIPISSILQDRIGMSVAVGNDAHTSALSERMFGSAHGMKDFIVVSIGVGLGSCIFTYGHECLGFGGYAGELGHICVVDHGRRCNCGLNGCLESYAAAHGIVQTAKEIMEENDAPSLMRDIAELTPQIISDLCDQGDALAIEVYKRAGYLLGLALATYASLVNPEAIILMGGISHAGHWLLDPTQDSFEGHVFQNMRGKVKLVISDQDDQDRNVLGASALAWEVQEYSLFK